MKPLDLAAQKRAARAEARARRAAISPETYASLGLSMARLLRASALWADARSVFCFCSAPGEPDTRPLLQAALTAGKRLYLPRCLPGRPGEMEAVWAASLEQLTPGKYGLLEPTGSRVAAPDALDLALLPCLAATRTGVRLGHGGGYYDRFLAAFPGVSVALCPEALIFPQLPAGPLDRPVDFILTEHALFSAEKAGKQRRCYR